MEYKTEEQKIKRFIYLKQELEKVMPSVINASSLATAHSNNKNKLK